MFLCECICLVKNKKGNAERDRKEKNGNLKQQSWERQIKKPKKKKKRLWLCVLTQPVKAMSSLFLLGGVPGLASCQPSEEPNDSFDPIRISAKSTLCSLRACTRQLTTRPPSMPTQSVPTSHALRVPDSPVVTGWAQQHAGNTLLSQCWLNRLHPQFSVLLRVHSKSLKTEKGCCYYTIFTRLLPSYNQQTQTEKCRVAASYSTTW